MKVKEFIKHMNDQGTNPRIKVYETHFDYNLLIYEGRPYEIREEIADKNVNGFTVRGVGFVEMYILPLRCEDDRKEVKT